jgi:hypothetical protein
MATSIFGDANNLDANPSVRVQRVENGFIVSAGGKQFVFATYKSMSKFLEENLE